MLAKLILTMTASREGRCFLKHRKFLNNVRRRQVPPATSLATSHIFTIKMAKYKNKNKTLTAKENQLNATLVPSGVHQFSLVCLFLLAILQFVEEFLGSARRCKRRSVKHDIYPQFRNDITEKFCAR